jgi:zinc D-Ala-D-Ala dipeptidase
MQQGGDGMKMSVFGAVALAATAGACASGPPDTAQSHVLVDIRTLSPAIRHDIRYATADNFTGRKVTGYRSPKCLLHAPVAKALSNVERGLNGRGYALVIFDCYRPTVAVDDFMRWTRNADNSSKAEYYPDLDKSVLVPDYIAEKSGHSKAATVDVGLLDCRTETCVKLDMGTSFDFFGARANTMYPEITAQQRDNRDLLLKAMAEQGFVNYPMEWWHFTWKAGLLPDQAYSFPIQ